MIVETGAGPVFVHTGGVPFDSSRPVIVLLHGAGMDHTVWRYQTRSLAHLGYAPLALDLPGHGRSGGAPFSTVEEMAHLVVEVLDQLGVEKATLIGHSLGPFVAMSVASEHPQRVERLVLMNCSDAMGVHPELLSAAQAGEHLAVELMVGWCHTGDARLSPRSDPGSWAPATTTRILEAGLRRSLAVDLAACAGFPAAKVATLLKVPTLVVIGKHDRMTPPAAGRRLANLIAGAEAVEVDSGHMAMVDAARAVQDTLVKWLKSTDAKAKG